MHPDAQGGLLANIEHPTFTPTSDVGANAEHPKGGGKTPKRGENGQKTA
jgi:hypothetical protein